MSFDRLGLRQKILENLKNLSFKQATAIQRLAIPFAIEGKDLLASAQTGTGKTAAFSTDYRETCR